jgi:fatty acyl-CoA reductase
MISGRNVFITGGTGFLGCVLIYKLLKFCPDIGNIYMLIREKRGVKHEERLLEMRSHRLLIEVEEQIPGQVAKLRVVQGDVMEKGENVKLYKVMQKQLILSAFTGLSISEVDRAELIKEISVVFHSAATVRFDEALSKAVSMNVRGTKEMLDLAKDMKHLVSFIHVSTCYCHCNRETEVIDEKIYPPEKESVEEVLAMCEGNEGK